MDPINRIRIAIARRLAPFARPEVARVYVARSPRCKTCGGWCGAEPEGWTIPNPHPTAFCGPLTLDEMRAWTTDQDLDRWNVEVTA